MNKSCKIATALFIIFLISTWTVYAGYTIYSNIITETVGEFALINFTKVISPEVINTTVSFFGTLQFDGEGVGNKTVYLLENINATSWVNIMSNTTDNNGLFQFTVNRTSLGTIQYKAGFDVL